MSEYQPYEAPRPRGRDGAPATRPENPAPGEAVWKVVVEYSNRGDAKPPTVLRVITDQYHDHADALERAEQEALTFDPPDPWSVQSRMVLADGDHGFLTVLEGATKTFHFTSRVARFVAEA